MNEQKWPLLAKLQSIGQGAKNIVGTAADAIRGKGLHYPGTSHCGPFTSDPSREPTGPMDYICKTHDAAYANAKTRQDVQKADREFQRDMTNLPGFSPKLMAWFIQTKSWIEQKLHRNIYPSQVYEALEHNPDWVKATEHIRPLKTERLLFHERLIKPSSTSLDIPAKRPLLEQIQDISRNLRAKNIILNVNFPHHTMSGNQRGPGIQIFQQKVQQMSLIKENENNSTTGTPQWEENYLQTPVCRSPGTNTIMVPEILKAVIALPHCLDQLIFQDNFTYTHALISTVPSSDLRGNNLEQLYDPRVLACARYSWGSNLFNAEFPSSIGSLYHWKPYQNFDLSDGVGNGILICSDRIYLSGFSTFYVSLASIHQYYTARILYRMTEIPISEYTRIRSLQQGGTTP